MKIDTYVEQMQESISVSEFRRLLALGKTETYWLLKKDNIKTVMVCGKTRVNLDSFNEWYENQTRYSRIDGIPPGRKLRENSYTVREIAEMLDVNEDTVYQRIYNHDFETFQAEHITRVTKESFEKWYVSQDKLHLPEDRERDEKMRGISYSQPEIARMLGIGRNMVYAIVKRESLECIMVAGQKRVLKTSFDSWYKSQNLYRKIEPKRKLEEKAFYTVTELIEGIGVDRSHIYRLIKRGIINVIKYGRGFLIPWEEAKKIRMEADNYGKYR